MTTAVLDVTMPRMDPGSQADANWALGELQDALGRIRRGETLQSPLQALFHCAYLAGAVDANRTDTRILAQALGRLPMSSGPASQVPMEMREPEEPVVSFVERAVRFSQSVRAFSLRSWVSHEWVGLKSANLARLAFVIIGLVIAGLIVLSLPTK